MRHIFGMAKSSLDLRGAKAQKLELEFLRLAYAVGFFRRQGVEAKGYLLVLAPGLKVRVAAWIAKYGTLDAVQCLVHPLSEADLERLQLEKVDNVDGMIAGAQGGDAVRRSDAHFGGHIGEHALRSAILRAEPGVVEKTDEGEPPLAVRWDFYGIVGEGRSIEA